MKRVLNLVTLLVITIVVIAIVCFIFCFPSYVLFDVSPTELIDGIYRASHSCEQSILPLYKAEPIYIEGAAVRDFSCDFQLLRFIIRILIILFFDIFLLWPIILFVFLVSISALASPFVGMYLFLTKKKI